MALLPFIGAMILAVVCLAPFVAAFAVAWLVGGWGAVVIFGVVLAIGMSIASPFLQTPNYPSAIQPISDPSPAGPAGASPAAPRSP